MINRPDVINGPCGPVGLDGPGEPGPEIEFLQPSFFLVHYQTKRQNHFQNLIQIILNFYWYIVTTLTMILHQDDDAIKVASNIINDIIGVACQSAEAVIVEEVPMNEAASENPAVEQSDAVEYCSPTLPPPRLRLPHPGRALPSPPADFQQGFASPRQPLPPSLHDIQLARPGQSGHPLPPPFAGSQPARFPLHPPPEPLLLLCDFPPPASLLHHNHPTPPLPPTLSQAPPGPAGQPGETGLPSTKGGDGRPGAKGPQGDKGDPGPNEPPGPPGLDGKHGEGGSLGPKGEEKPVKELVPEEIAKIGLGKVAAAVDLIDAALDMLTVELEFTEDSLATACEQIYSIAGNDRTALDILVSDINTWLTSEVKHVKGLDSSLAIPRTITSAKESLEKIKNSITTSKVKIEAGLTLLSNIAADRYITDDSVDNLVIDMNAAKGSLDTIKAFIEMGLNLIAEYTNTATSGTQNRDGLEVLTCFQGNAMASLDLIKSWIDLQKDKIEAMLLDSKRKDLREHLKATEAAVETTVVEGHAGEETDAVTPAQPPEPTTALSAVENEQDGTRNYFVLKRNGNILCQEHDSALPITEARAAEGEEATVESTVREKKPGQFSQQVNNFYFYRPYYS